MSADRRYEEIDFGYASDHVHQKQRYQRRPRRTAEMLSQLMARKGYGQTGADGELHEAWEIAVGPKFIRHTRAGRIHRGLLEVFTASSAISNQLSFLKKQLLSAMQQQLPQNKITDIRFKIGNVASDE